MPHVIELDDPAELEQYRLLWDCLWRQTRGATLFQAFSWLQTYWRHFGSGQRLRVLLVSSAGQTVGILPLTVKVESTRVGEVRLLTYPLHDWGSFYGPIGPNPTATLAVAMRYLAATRDWDMLDLRWIDSRIDAGRTQLAMQAAGMQGWQQVWKRTSLVEFDGSWDQYLGSRSSKFRQALRRCERRARDWGQLTYERHRPGQAMDAGEDLCDRSFEECLEVAERSWQAGSATGTTLCHPGVLRFFRDVHLTAAALGAVDVNLLRLDGRVIAFSYNYHHDGSLFGVRMGYDPEFAALSPGTLVLARSLEDSFARGDRCLDLGVDSLHFKQHWLTRTAPVSRCSHYRLASARSQLLRLKRWLVRGVASC